MSGRRIQALVFLLCFALLVYASAGAFAAAAADAADALPEERAAASADSLISLTWENAESEPLLPCSAVWNPASHQYDLTFTGTAMLLTNLSQSETVSVCLTFTGAGAFGGGLATEAFGEPTSTVVVVLEPEARQDVYITIRDVSLDEIPPDEGLSGDGAEFRLGSVVCTAELVAPSEALSSDNTAANPAALLPDGISSDTMPQENVSATAPEDVGEPAKAADIAASAPNQSDAFKAAIPI